MAKKTIKIIKNEIIVDFIDPIQRICSTKIGEPLFVVTFTRGDERYSYILNTQFEVFDISNPSQKLPRWTKKLPEALKEYARVRDENLNDLALTEFMKSAKYYYPVAEKQEDLPPKYKTGGHKWLNVAGNNYCVSISASAEIMQLLNRYSVKI